MPRNKNSAAAARRAATRARRRAARQRQKAKNPDWGVLAVARAHGLGARAATALAAQTARLEARMRKLMADGLTRAAAEERALDEHFGDDAALRARAEYARGRLRQLRDAGLRPAAAMALAREEALRRHV